IEQAISHTAAAPSGPDAHLQYPAGRVIHSFADRISDRLTPAPEQQRKIPSKAIAVREGGPPLVLAPAREAGPFAERFLVDAKEFGRRFTRPRVEGHVRTQVDRWRRRDPACQLILGYVQREPVGGQELGGPGGYPVNVEAQRRRLALAAPDERFCPSQHCCANSAAASRLVHGTLKEGSVLMRLATFEPESRLAHDGFAHGSEEAGRAVFLGHLPAQTSARARLVEHR